VGELVGVQVGAATGAATRLPEQRVSCALCHVLLHDAPSNNQAASNRQDRGAGGGGAGVARSAGGGRRREAGPVWCVVLVFRAEQGVIFRFWPRTSASGMKKRPKLHELPHLI
jgi:hypothetical protein